MPIERKPFSPQKTAEEREAMPGKTIGIWFNDEELYAIEGYKELLQQEKDSTAIKQMIGLGANLLKDPKVLMVRDLIQSNIRKNERLGIDEIDPKIRKS